MYTFEFLENAYWTVDEELNMAYIRTIGEETVDAVLLKIDIMTQDRRWNVDSLLINDYEDLSSVKLKTRDILRITTFQESVNKRIEKNKWYFLTSNLMHYGVIRMYATYINNPSDPQIIVHKKIKQIEDDRLRQFASECRYDCRVFEKLTADPKK